MSPGTLIYLELPGLDWIWLDRFQCGIGEPAGRCDRLLSAAVAFEFGTGVPDFLAEVVDLQWRDSLKIQ